MITIWKETKLRCNPHARYTAPDGTKYVKVPAELYEEVPDTVPVPDDYSPDTYRKLEPDADPYVVYEKKSDEEITALRLAQAKQARAQVVSEIVVTTQAGNSFDGNEDAQNRMSRAINGLEDDLETVLWVLADNSLAQVNRAELKEALRLSGIAQTEAWVVPYTS